MLLGNAKTIKWISIAALGLSFVPLVSRLRLSLINNQSLSFCHDPFMIWSGAMNHYKQGLILAVDVSARSDF